VDGARTTSAADRLSTVTDDTVGPDLLTVAQVMARLQIGRHTVYDLIRSRRLRSVRIGRCRRIPAAALRDFLNTLTD
jgi:excisionase family DNA binding protein